jgi:transcriptional regulator with XRE-family HTH domain
MIRQKVGYRIKELRTKMGLSQEKLALLTDLDRTYIASVESGKRNISIVNLEKIVKALEYTLGEFFCDM